MLDNATITQLRALKLQGFADALQQQHEQADCLGLSFDERLALLVEREVYARGDRKRERLLQRAQLKYPTATIEDASFEGVRGIDRAALLGLALSHLDRARRDHHLRRRHRSGQDLVGLRAGPVRLPPGPLGAASARAATGRRNCASSTARAASAVGCSNWPRPTCSSSPIGARRH